MELGEPPAAMTAIAVQKLARADSVSIGFIGCGVQARSHFDVLRLVLPDLKEVVACSRWPIWLWHRSSTRQRCGKAWVRGWRAELTVCFGSKADKKMAGNNRPRSPLPPTPRALKRPFPLFHPSLRLLALHFRLEALRHFPLFRDFLASPPPAGGHAREISRAHGRGSQ